MRGVIVAVAVLVCGCTGDRITNVYGAAQGGDAATGGGGESASGGGGSGSTGGSGGLGGNGSGGGGGAGGAPCVPVTCAAHGVCGPLPDDGCGAPLDCPVADCGPEQVVECGKAGYCTCTDASSASEPQSQCMLNADAQAWCGDTCKAAFCGEAPKPLAPLNCIPIDYHAGVSQVWCCQS